jgi:hypothetical protein
MTMDEQRLNLGYPPYIFEYYTKILKTNPKDVPRYKRQINYLEWHFKKFASKDSRDKIFKLMQESILQKVYLKPIQTQEEIDSQQSASKNLLNSGAAGIRGIKRNIETT